MKTSLLTLLLLYIACCLILFLLQRSFLYFPQPAGHVTGVAEIHVDTDGETLNGWVVNKDRPKALIYYGGNAENIATNIPFFETALSDYSVYLVPYRGYGNSTGKPTEENLYHDALTIFDQVKNQHKLISLMGRSLGTGVATHVASIRQIDKLILVTPFDSIENVARDIYWMFPVSLLITDKFRSLDKVKNIKAKTTFFVAEKDRVIPRVRTDQLIALFPNEQVDTIVIAEADHNDISSYPEYIAGLTHALK